MKTKPLSHFIFIILTVISTLQISMVVDYELILLLDQENYVIPKDKESFKIPFKIDFQFYTAASTHIKKIKVHATAKNLNKACALDLPLNDTQPLQAKGVQSFYIRSDFLINCMGSSLKAEEFFITVTMTTQRPNGKIDELNSNKQLIKLSFENEPQIRNKKTS